MWVWPGLPHLCQALQNFPETAVMWQDFRVALLLSSSEHCSCQQQSVTIFARLLSGYAVSAAFVSKDKGEQISLLHFFLVPWARDASVPKF